MIFPLKKDSKYPSGFSGFHALAEIPFSRSRFYEIFIQWISGASIRKSNIEHAADAWRYVCYFHAFGRITMANPFSVKKQGHPGIIRERGTMRASGTRIFHPSGR